MSENGETHMGLHDDKDTFALQQLLRETIAERDQLRIAAMLALNAIGLYLEHENSPSKPYYKSDVDRAILELTNVLRHAKKQP